MNKRESLQEYVSFNPTLFLKESKKWNKQIKDCEMSLEEKSELPAIESSGVQTSNISDMTPRQAFDNLEIYSELNRLKGLVEVKEWVMTQLSDDEKELINGFFFGDVRSVYFVQEYGAKHALCRSDVYTARKNAVKKVAELIESKYGV